MDSSYKKAIDIFFSIEQKFNLLSYKINGLYFWQLSRVNIYLKIINTINQHGNNFHVNNKGKNIRLFHRILINSFFFNPFVDCRKKDFLVFESGRRYNDGAKHIDIYTHYLCERMTKNGESFTLYKKGYDSTDQLSRKSVHVKHIDFITLLTRIIRFFYTIRISINDMKFIKKIENEINERYNININLLDIIKIDLINFKCQFPLYKLLFRIKSPKEIYIINSSDNQYIVDAAKKLGIIVNELQHGLISDYDVICNFPNTEPDSLEYFPDRFFIWNNIDMCFGSLPLSKKNIIYFKNEHLDKWVRKTENIDKEFKTILIISQPNSSIEMVQFMEKNIPEMGDYIFLYKIHPAENILVINMYKEKLEKKYHNVKFINNEEPIYLLLKKSEFVIGIFSSALFEATLFNCKIILLDLPGVEMSVPLLKTHNAKLLDINCSIVSVLK